MEYNPREIHAYGDGSRFGYRIVRPEEDRSRTEFESELFCSSKDSAVLEGLCHESFAND